MKKYVVGILIGAVLMYSGQAVAGSISKIGKKVQAEYTIKVDGKTLDAKALAVDGMTVTPNRALADAVGYDVAFVNKEVILTKKVTVIVDPGVPEPVYTLEEVNEAIKNLEGDIWASKATIQSYKDRGLTNSIPVAEDALKKQEAELEVWKQRKLDLESK